jgi:poly(3-hydroxybutyrate) depolymerase
MTFKTLRAIAPVCVVVAGVMAVSALAVQDAAAQSGRPTSIIRVAPATPAPPSTNPQLAVDQIPGAANVYGLISDLNKRVNALEKQIDQLKQVNAEQTAQLQSLSSQTQNLATALGQTNIKLTSQGQDLAATKQSLAGLTTKFANHKHPFSYLAVDYWNVNVVKESHVSGDDMQEVAHITGNHPVPSTTGAPQ